jgi:predicted phosphodiesterase
VRVAALFDVHGNRPALEAVLAEAGDVAAFVFGGDLVFGAWPRETLELALSLGDRAHLIRGNWERYAGEGHPHPHVAWLREKLAGYDVDWQTTLALDGVLYCHATPDDEEALVLPELASSPWHAFADVAEPLVVCGHVHVQFDVEREGKRIVNAGSVGNPTVRATAWWAMVEAGDVELRTTDYDTASTAAAMRATSFPRVDFADELVQPYTVEQVVELIERAA